MVPKLFGGGGQSKSTTRSLEIIPDSPFVVFYGNSPDSPPAELTGTVVLTNSGPVDVKTITIQLQGVQKVSYNAAADMVTKTDFLDENLRLFPPEASMASTLHRIKPGVQKWPFKFLLPTTLPESVEGLASTYIGYWLHASAERSYMGSKLFAQSKRIRLIRTLGVDALDSINLEQASINEDVWSNKISYRITVPRVNYIFGTAITAEFILTPIKKALTVGQIKLELVETVHLSYESLGRSLKKKEDTVICKVEGDMPDNSETLVTNIHPESLCDESYHFKMQLPLERSLRKCRQSCETDSIKIEHRLRIFVSLHNPEGHTSQLLVKNLVNLFISPNLPVGENDCVSVSPSQMEPLNDAATSITAPPSYDVHQLDLLYADIDQSGLVTPAPWLSGANSGLNTPFYNLSRNPSGEDIPSTLNAIAQTNGDSNGASASLLHTRLANLQENGSPQAALNALNGSGATTPYRQNNQDDSPSSSHHSSNAPSRNPSGLFAPTVVNPETGNVEYDMDALARTPSYNTAVRAPISSRNSQIGLPSYEVATSRQPSPGTSPPSRPPPPPPIGPRQSEPRQSSEPWPQMRDGRSNSAATRSSVSTEDDMRVGRSNSAATRSSLSTEDGMTLAPPAPAALPRGSAIRETSRSRGSSLRRSIDDEPPEREVSRTRRPEAVHFDMS